MEKGNIRLIGATTENPSFEIISALLSRCRVYVLNPLTAEQLIMLMQRALEDQERGLGPLRLTADEAGLERIAAYSSGDARSAYNALEVAATLAVEQPKAAPAAARLRPRLWKARCRSACCSTTRPARSTTTSSPPCTSLCATATRMPRSTGWGACWRRAKIRSSSSAGWCAWRWRTSVWPIRTRWSWQWRLAMRWTLSACLKETWRWPRQPSTWRWRRSRTRSTRLIEQVQRDVAETAAEPVPLHLRNAPTSLMKNLGYGEGYQYAHNLDDKVADMQCLPDNLKSRVYYHPTGEGVEKRIQERMQMLREKRESARRKGRE